jgi:Xaa-Pro aminopeptidase
MVCAYLYDCINAMKYGPTGIGVMLKWPGSSQWWGYDDWNDIGPYALGHGLGLSLHDRPFFNQQNVHAGMKPQTFKEAMCIAVEFYTGRKGGKDGARPEENILVAKDDYELLSPWPIDELMECWLPYKSVVDTEWLLA